MRSVPAHPATVSPESSSTHPASVKLEPQPAASASTSTGSHACAQLRRASRTGSASPRAPQHSFTTEAQLQRRRHQRLVIAPSADGTFLLTIGAAAG
ncbi:hypothetical protein OC834_006940 [Tilletia horrida]|nr:hypothetical protein OC834_006940 [Tilletia horrida]